VTVVSAERVDCSLTHAPGTRRRGSVLEDAIHAAVFDELAGVGYAAFTIESVAARAKTGKASIYRRWPTKQSLVLDAFCTRFGGPDDILASLTDDTLTTRDLLVKVGSGVCQMSGEAGEVMRAVACEVNRDAGLKAAVEEQVHRPKQAALQAVLERGVARGEVRTEAATDLYGDVLPAMLTYQAILLNRPMTQEAVAKIVDQIVMPLLAP
jgi:AcrR family transcriptional regulator